MKRTLTAQLKQQQQQQQQEQQQQVISDDLQGIITSEEIEILRWMNVARQSPQEFAAMLNQTLLPNFDGLILREPNRVAVRTQEGAKAVQEAIQVLEKMPSLPPLSLAAGLYLAARDHARTMGEAGTTGHKGTDGTTPFTRIERYGAWQRTAGENIDYGSDRGRDVVKALMVDDGVASRGHRKNILSPLFTVCGTAIAPHSYYKHTAVIDFAGGFVERGVKAKLAKEKEKLAAAASASVDAAGPESERKEQKSSPAAQATAVAPAAVSAAAAASSASTPLQRQATVERRADFTPGAAEHAAAKIQKVARGSLQRAYSRTLKDAKKAGAPTLRLDGSVDGADVNQLISQAQTFIGSIPKALQVNVLNQLRSALDKKAIATLTKHNTRVAVATERQTADGGWARGTFVASWGQ